MDTIIQVWHEYRWIIVVCTIVIFTVYKGLYDGVDEGTTDSRRVKPLGMGIKGGTTGTLDGLKEIESVTKTPRKVIRGSGVVKKGMMKLGQVSDSGEVAIRIIFSIFYVSITGNSRKIAQRIAQQLRDCRDMKIEEVRVYDIADIEVDDYFTKVEDSQSVYLLVVPSYNVDTMVSEFVQSLRETWYDVRLNAGSLSGLLGYAVFGIGDREGWPNVKEGFCFQAEEVDRWLGRLTGKKSIYSVGMSDIGSDGWERVDTWISGVKSRVNGQLMREDIRENDNAMDSEGDEAQIMEREISIADMEDLGVSVNAAGQIEKLQSKEMVNQSSITYKNLTKQGYSIIGSHSGVKICRWTKSALRGRGFCYKYTFYGIKSHLCMETTPSLSCSNKCVFCWRHGTNPVGTSWKWKIDEPQDIFRGVKDAHYRKIRQMKGVPGIRQDRFAEAQKIRHCALSLVGEPVFYPRINEFVDLLHAEQISSFLVCNAQHPDELSRLNRVTQLYVSVDASNRESLRRIDRPLHRDFWQRFLRCLSILALKRFEQRTVFRLTLVKGFNMNNEVAGYADLIALALPCFIEIKGVTYCGVTSKTSPGSISMSNVPYHEEICEFARQLVLQLDLKNLHYGIAAQHAHSCCVLIASHRFRRNDKWHTWIDYDAFFSHLRSGAPFTPEDYMHPDPTPTWALNNALAAGFSPDDQRFYRRQPIPQTSPPVIPPISPATLPL